MAGLQPSVTAGTIINSVRDLVPDPVYNASNQAQPDSDGGVFKAQTLYRWLNNGLQALAQKVGWDVDDWYAFPTVASQPFYVIPAAWSRFDIGFHNGLRLSLYDERGTIYQKLVTSNQAGWFGVHRRVDHLEMFLFAAPNATDPATTVNEGGGMGTTDTSVTVVATTGFLPFGYVQIDSELIAYHTVTATSLGVLQRGQCGTTAAAHANGATVTHCAAWMKGARMPNQVAASTDLLEVPVGWTWALEEYLLGRCNYSQNDEQAGKLHMDNFYTECARIYADPLWRDDHQGVQVPAYGMTAVGGMRFNQGNPWGLIIG